MGKSAIDYAAIETMSSDITDIKNNINNIFTNELCGNVINSIAGHYSGDAAESYKSRFDALSKKALDSLEQVTTTMTQKLEQTVSEYQSQDQALS